MAKKPVEVVVVIDRSGSMSSIRSDAIGGFNTFLSEQQKVKGKANLTLILFDTVYDVVHKSVPIKDVPPLTEATYIPNGLTALNDAIGRALAALESVAPDKAIVCILTDGGENASKEETTASIKARITAAEAKGWQFVYLGANQDAFAVGQQLGVQAQFTQNFDANAKGTQIAYATLSASTTKYRTK